MHAEAPSVVLVSTTPATIDLVRSACTNGGSSAIPFEAAVDTGSARQHISDLDGAVVVLECDGTTQPAASLRPFVGEDAVAPVIALTQDASPELEQALMEAGATDVLPVAELSHGTLRRAL